MAEGNIELVVTRLPNLLAVTLRGPVSQGSFVECPADGEWLAVRFRLGTYLRSVPTAALMDHRSVNLPLLSNERFWFGDRAFEIPSFDNAEQLVASLARAGLILRDSAIDAAVEGDVGWMSRRSVQRHFRRTTGMTISGYTQIERARRAATLLMDGQPILHTAYEAGYADQAHLTRSLKKLIGVTPAALVGQRPQLSFSFKTSSSLPGNLFPPQTARA
jgi:AraC-like DNA-binding protein